MMADLEDGDDQTRLDTATNLVEHPPDVDDALRVLRKALDDPLARVNELAEQALSRLSRNLNVDDLNRYEARIQEDPSDLATLTVVLWVYLSARSHSEAIKTSQRWLVLWVIEVMPGARVAGSHPIACLCQDADLLNQAKRLWLSHVEKNPRDARLIGNAAKFFSLVDELKSEELFRLCNVIEPENPEWSWHLGRCYAMWRSAARVSKRQIGVR